MPKSIEKVPETVAELKALLPELCTQIEDNARASVDTQGLEAAARSNECERMLGLLTIEMGQEVSDKFKALLGTNVTVEQFTAIKALQPAASSEAVKADDMKAQILAELKKAGADNPGAGGDQAAGGQDWQTLVNQYQADAKCTRTQAIKAVDTQHPGLREKYLDRVNAGRK